MQLHKSEVIDCSSNTIKEISHVVKYQKLKFIYQNFKKHTIRINEMTSKFRTISDKFTVNLCHKKFT